MARETEAFARAVADNEAAAKVPEGTTVDDTLLGPIILIELEAEGVTDMSPTDAWDMYAVEHSGYVHLWSSAVVLATFAKS